MIDKQIKNDPKIGDRTYIVSWCSYYPRYSEREEVDADSIEYDNEYFENKFDAIERAKYAANNLAVDGVSEVLAVIFKAIPSLKSPYGGFWVATGESETY